MYTFEDVQNKAFDEECLKSSVKFATSGMLWDCKIPQTQGRLWIVSKTAYLEVHREILGHFMTPSPENLCDENFRFQQDSASFRYSTVDRKNQSST